MLFCLFQCLSCKIALFRLNVVWTMHCMITNLSVILSVCFVVCILLTCGICREQPVYTWIMCCLVRSVVINPVCFTSVIVFMYYVQKLRTGSSRREYLGIIWARFVALPDTQTNSNKCKVVLWSIRTSADLWFLSRLWYNTCTQVHSNKALKKIMCTDSNKKNPIRYCPGDVETICSLTDGSLTVAKIAAGLCLSTDASTVHTSLVVSSG